MSSGTVMLSLVKILLLFMIMFTFSNLNLNFIIILARNTSEDKLKKNDRDGWNVITRIYIKGKY